MYKKNTYGKIVINEKEVYYGCITDFDLKIGIAKLKVIDWKKRTIQPLQYYEMTVPTTKFTIKYCEGGNQ